MKKHTPQCQATTVAGTYSSPHRCLKRSGVRKLGPLLLCAHHRASASRARA